MGMNFIEALKVMKQGGKVKLPSWGGYWYWDKEKETVMIQCRPQDSDIGGESTFPFSDAIKYLKRGMKVARKGWNGKKQYIQLATGISYTFGDDVVNCEHEAIGNQAIAFVGTSGVQIGWLASQADMLADDWVFAE